MIIHDIDFAEESRYTCKRGMKDTIGTIKLINQKKKMTTPWLKMKRTNRQTIVHRTQHRKLKNKQHEPHQKAVSYICER